MERGRVPIGIVTVTNEGLFAERPFHEYADNRGRWETLQEFVNHLTKTYGRRIEGWS